MIKVGGLGTLDERLLKLEQSINRSPVVYPFSVIDDNEVSVPTGGVVFGGIAVDRSVFRAKLPDAQWVVWAAGFVNPGDANGITVSLVYQKDDLTQIGLGSATYTGAGFVKKALGPFDVFGTASVPKTETIPAIRLKGVKLTSGTATMVAWNIWLELRASVQ